MKRIAPLLVSLALFTGCAHSQHTSYKAQTVAVTAAVVAGLVLATVLVPCAQCNDTFITTDSGAHR